MRWRNIMATKYSLALIALAACGDDGGSASRDAAMRDTPVMTDALPAGCDYVELQDATNDTTGTGTAEPTNLTLGSSLAICGAIEHTHFEDVYVDTDSFVFSVGTETDVLVRLKGAGLEAIEFVGIDVYTGTNFDQRVAAPTFYYDHAVASVHVPPGSYMLTAFALHSAALTATVPYKLEVITDSPGVRCPELTSGGYAEANDGGSNNGNDVIRIASTTPALTAAADAPEPTGLTLSSTSDQRLTGSSANITAADAYEDMDTFAFATSAMTNELTVRLTWALTGTNLDFYLLEANDPSPALRVISTATQSPELATFPIKPSTNYWLAVGAKAGSTGLPKAYSASLCPVRYVP